MIKHVTDKNGDDWEVLPSGMLKRGQRILKRSTVEQHLGPLVPRPTHGDPDQPGPTLDEATRSAMAVQLNADQATLLRVRSFAFELHRDPRKYGTPEMAAEALMTCLGLPLGG